MRGRARPTKPTSSTTSSGYVLIQGSRTTDVTVNTLAHELAHVRKWVSTLKKLVRTGCGSSKARRMGGIQGCEVAGPYTRLLLSLLDPNGFPQHPLSLGAALQPLGPHFEYIRCRYQSWLLYSQVRSTLEMTSPSRHGGHAAAPGPQGIEALEDAMPFDVYFPRFAVRNWHQDFESGTFLKSLATARFHLT